MTTNKEQNIVLMVQGGAGDVIAFSPCLRFFRSKYPLDNIVVISTYHKLWNGNPNVDEVIPFADLKSAYQRYAIEKKVRLWKKHFVYDEFLDDTRYASSTLPEFICKVYDAEYDGGKLDYYVSPEEDSFARFYLKQFAKPVILVHGFGAVPSEGVMRKVHDHKDIDVPAISELIDKYKKDFTFVQIGLAGEPLIKNNSRGEIDGFVDGLGMHMREAIALIPHCKSFIFIESLFAHCSSALNKRGVVICNNTDPKFFGYENNINITNYNCGCPIHPCNRPVGALGDLASGYLDPKTRQIPLWSCGDVKCRIIDRNILDSAFMSSLVVPASSIEEARRQ